MLELLRACPLLVQSNTEKSLTIPDTSYTRTFFIECLGDKCAAYQDGVCAKFGGKVTYEDDTEKEEAEGK